MATVKLSEQELSDLVLACIARKNELMDQIGEHVGPHRLDAPLVRAHALLQRLGNLS